MKCPDCANTEFKKESGEVYCTKCGLVLTEDFSTVENPYGENSLTIDNGLHLEVQMVNIERKYNYRSRSNERFRKFKRHYYDLLEDVLLENGYMMYDVPHIFYNHFLQWYNHNSKRIGNKKRIDVINWFLMEWEV